MHNSGVIAELASIGYKPEKFLGTIGGKVLTFLASSHDFMGA
jgi:hypothetical protein